jgi:hypothetical protein
VLVFFAVRSTCDVIKCTNYTEDPPYSQSVVRSLTLPICHRKPFLSNCWFSFLSYNWKDTPRIAAGPF